MPLADHRPQHAEGRGARRVSRGAPARGGRHRRARRLRKIRAHAGRLRREQDRARQGPVPRARDDGRAAEGHARGGYVLPAAGSEGGGARHALHLQCEHDAVRAAPLPAAARHGLALQDRPEPALGEDGRARPAGVPEPAATGGAPLRGEPAEGALREGARPRGRPVRLRRADCRRGHGHPERALRAHQGTVRDLLRRGRGVVRLARDPAPLPPRLRDAPRPPRRLAHRSGHQRGDHLPALLRRGPRGMTQPRMTSQPLTTPVHEDAGEAARRHGLAHLAERVFVNVGVLPLLLAIALVMFSLLSNQLLTTQNMVNLFRQSVYLILVSLGQMLALVTGGFDLSVGTIQAVTSVVSAMVMSAIVAHSPDAAWLAILAGAAAGIAAGILVGVVNGVGIAFLGVTPFIMTLGVQSVGFGVALFLTGGVPVAGLPDVFGETFGFGHVLGVPVPVAITLLCTGAFLLLLNRTALGNYFHAVGGNPKAAALSGISTRRVLMMAYLLCAGVAALSGLLLTARVDSGEANIGGT